MEEKVKYCKIKKQYDRDGRTVTEFDTNVTFDSIDEAMADFQNR